MLDVRLRSLAARSAREFPITNIVRPMTASDNPNMKPNAWGEIVITWMTKSRNGEPGGR